jgi:hypothetical protein
MTGCGLWKAWSSMANDVIYDHTHNVIYGKKRDLRGAWSFLHHGLITSESASA